ncbi:GDSL-type esterase/lipase family protein [Paenibacillus sp. CC-CFT747]|nr:GDSL-type esterase/lipase family protein [Paenibacillus sp. CC-CFT747]
MSGTRVRVLSDSDTASPNLIEYVEGLDYVVDYQKATICRMKGSRIPDWSVHPLYGITDFDHTKYEVYSNRAYTVYAVYDGEAAVSDLEYHQGSSKLAAIIPRAAAKLQEGKEVVFVVYGDSISAGGEATQERFTFYHRFAEYLSRLYPDGNIHIMNRAIGGETSLGGASRVENDVLPVKPDLISIGYGMNDQNLYEHGLGVSLEDYERNIRHIIETIRMKSESDIILVTPCEPNPCGFIRADE